MKKINLSKIIVIFIKNVSIIGTFLKSAYRYFWQNHHRWSLFGEKSGSSV